MTLPKDPIERAETIVDREKRALRDEIRGRWPGSKIVDDRIVTVPEVRDGGMTAQLIDLAVEVAFERLG